MTETPGTPESPAVEPTTAATLRRAAEPPRFERDNRNERLHTVLVWVGIVTGVVFILAVTFFSGFFIGRYADGASGVHRDHDRMMEQMMERMMQGGGMMGPGQMGPGQMRPGPVGPDQQPSPSTAPTTMPRP
jgi:hypothetical protein